MHYRITKVYHEAGKREALAELLNEKKGMLKDFDGLKSVRMVGVSETATIAVSEYETEDQLKAVEVGEFSLSLLVCYKEERQLYTCLGC